MRFTELQECWFDLRRVPKDSVGKHQAPVGQLLARRFRVWRGSELEIHATKVIARLYRWPRTCFLIPAILDAPAPAATFLSTPRILANIAWLAVQKAAIPASRNS